MLVDALLLAPLAAVVAPFALPAELHAVADDELVRGWPDGPVAAACGAGGLSLLAWGGAPVLWPPSTRGMPSGLSRCHVCWEATGRRRPRSRFRPRARSTA